MTGEPENLADTLRFQLSLLRLAVIPHASSQSAPVTGAAQQLSELASKVPVPPKMPPGVSK